MSGEAAGEAVHDAAGSPAPTDGVPETLGLWSEQWFRVLTILNSSIVLVSAAVGWLMLWDDSGSLFGTLFLAFPVVPATVMFPPLSLIVVGVAAALSSLNMLAGQQKGVRFLRAMTVWGTIVLVVPVVFTGIGAVAGAVGSLL